MQLEDSDGSVHQERYHEYMIRKVKELRDETDQRQDRSRSCGNS